MFWVKLIGLVVLTFAVYLPATRCGFIWDDDILVTDNVNLRSGQGLRRTWFEPAGNVQYFPVVFSTFWVQYHLWGDRPLGYHVVNIVFHGLNAVFLWLVLRRLAAPGAWLGAALFALHPVNVETVAWISEWKNVLSGTFFLAALMAYLNLALNEGRKNRNWWLYGTSWLLFVLALLSKSTTVILPAVALVIVWWKKERLRWRDLVPLAPMMAAGVAMGLMTSWVERTRWNMTGECFSLTFWQRSMIAGRALWFYAGKLALPIELLPSYPRWTVSPPDALMVASAICAMAALVMLIVGRRWIGKGAVAAVLIFAGAHFPTLSFVNYGYLFHGYVADRFQYLPGLAMLALAAGTGTVVLDRLGRMGRRCGIAASVGVLCALAVLTWQQQGMYKDLATYSRASVAGNPGCWSGLANIGYGLCGEGRFAESIDYYTRALKVNPRAPRVWTLLGDAYRGLGKFTEALGAYNDALRLDPRNADALYGIGNVLVRQGRLSEAARKFEQALASKPADMRIYRSLGEALAMQGRTADSLAIFEQALSLDPNNAAVLNNLAWMLATAGPEHRNPAEAVRLAERAARKTAFKDVTVLYTLGVAYGENGQIPQAIDALEKTNALAQSVGNREFQAKAQRRLTLYRK